MEEILVTVCTPTYNRANLLHRPFESLMQQTNKNFKWLIIDDGSKDNTREIVEKFKKKADFEIEYHYKENEGRHTALNYSYEFINSEWVINLDSDDTYCNDTIDKIYMIIKKLKKLPEKEYNEMWQICGRYIDSETRSLIGKAYPKNINNLTRKKQDKARSKIKGDKACCRKVRILRKYPFPKYEDTNFVTEDTIWYKIDLDYKSYCTNEVFGIYYQNSTDSLTRKSSNEKVYKNLYHFSIFCLNELLTQITYKREVQKAVINLPRGALMLKRSYKEVMRELNSLFSKFLVTMIGYPVAYLYIKIIEKV